MRQSELERLAPKLSGLPPEAKARVEEVTRLLIHKLLMTPTEQLKTVDDEAAAARYAETISQLFSLDEPVQTEKPQSTEPADEVSSSTSKTPVTS